MEACKMLMVVEFKNRNNSLGIFDRSMNKKLYCARNM